VTEHVGEQPQEWNGLISAVARPVQIDREVRMRIDPQRGFHRAAAIPGFGRLRRRDRPETTSTKRLANRRRLRRVRHRCGQSGGLRQFASTSIPAAAGGADRHTSARSPIASTAPD